MLREFFYGNFMFVIIVGMFSENFFNKIKSVWIDEKKC